MTEKLFTIGVYGSTEDSFFQTLSDAEIDLFCDIRQRRGLRGKKYRYANSLYLQNRLQELDIAYLHEKALAPTSEIRQAQKDDDALENIAKRERETLGDTFISLYQSDILQPFDIDTFIKQVEQYRHICFFCVEQSPKACHRSIVALSLKDKLKIPLINLMP